MNLLVVGRLYQVEYAMEAIGHAGTCLGKSSIFVTVYKVEDIYNCCIYLKEFLPLMALSWLLRGATPTSYLMKSSFLKRSIS